MQIYSSQIVSKNVNGKKNVEKTEIKHDGKKGEKTVTKIKNGKKTTKKTKLKSSIPPISPPMLQTLSPMRTMRPLSISPNFISPFLTIIRRNPQSLKKVTKKRALKDSGGKIKKKRRKKTQRKPKAKPKAKAKAKPKAKPKAKAKRNKNWFEKIFDV
jgi:hypothetical protein